MQFLQLPQAMIDKGDGYALKLKQEAPRRGHADHQRHVSPRAQNCCCR